MDATCNVQDSIHVFHLVHNMCPGFWVHIKMIGLIENSKTIPSVEIALKLAKVLKEPIEHLFRL